MKCALNDLNRSSISNTVANDQKATKGDPDKERVNPYILNTPQRSCDKKTHVEEEAKSTTNVTELLNTNRLTNLSVKEQQSRCVVLNIKKQNENNQVKEKNLQLKAQLYLDSYCHNVWCVLIRSYVHLHDWN